MPELSDVQRIPAAPITGVHLWFDRPVCPLPHAALVGRTGQWIFQRPASEEESLTGNHYCQVVISASHQLVGESREEVVERVCRELGAIWPAVRAARLLWSRVITHPVAVFSLQPGVERLRPGASTSINNLFLAGDWTRTGWPATMEGAVRSGYQAVEEIKRVDGQS
jgi:uncharacterized protein with NAD-binding domain and iron-sulfur cluster